jgi:hypothetical protein
MDHAFQILYVYLCAPFKTQPAFRVLTSNDAVLADPLTEVHQLPTNLHTKCGVPGQ